MSTQPNAMTDSSISSPASVWARTMYWSIRRELWENRSIYVVPLAAAGVFLFGFAINLVTLQHRFSAPWLRPIEAHHVLTSGSEVSAALIMGAALIVGIFYSLECLYGERRDRSILFWKSLPVSDLTTVLSKLTIPLVIVPLLSFAISLATQIIMLLMSSVMGLASGANIAALWTEVPFFHVSLVLFYHLLAIHGLWYAPLYAWLLLVSVWAPRAPFLWAVLPPFVIYGVEKIAFNTSQFLGWLQYRLMGPGDSTPPGGHPKDFMATLMPEHFLSTPGLWTGLALAVVLLFAAVRLRRYRGPV